MSTIHSAQGGESEVVPYTPTLRRAHYFPGICSKVPALFFFFKLQHSASPMLN